MDNGEQHPMKLLTGMISTAVLTLMLGAAAPVYALQDQHDQQDQEKAKPAQDEKKAQPEKPAKPEERNARQDDNGKPEEKNTRQQPTEAKRGEPAQRADNGNGRIPDDRYKANFGREHTFHVSRGDYGNRSFQYGRLFVRIC